MSGGKAALSLPTRRGQRVPPKTKLVQALRSLAPIGHVRELPACFPWLLLVPRDCGVVMIVWILHEGSVVLCRARGHRYDECTQQDGDDEYSKVTDLCQHRLQCLQVVLGRHAPSCWS